MTTMWRIFEDKNDLPHTLFRGLNGSRTLALDTWHEAEVKEGYDGPSSTYTTGFHVLTNRQAVVDFLNRFRNLEGRVICAVLVDEDAGMWYKEHSPAEDLRLVKRMKITAEQWAQRVPLLDLKEV